MSSATDLYAVLGVPADSSEEEIRRTYRSVARRLHPDVNHNPGAARQFRDITSAHEILSDPVSRQKYDQKRKHGDHDRAYFTLRVTPSKRVLPVMSEPQVLYLLFELVPDPSFSKSQVTAPINLALVIDHSTSMRGARIERTKIAAHQILDQLSEKDIVSVVALSDHADVLVKAGPVTDKPSARALVSTLQPSGSTSMLEGLQAGYDETQRYIGRKFVNHIILITDGRTYGDEPDCIKLAERCAENGIGISAMGIGEDWNDKFLDQLASTTGGTCEYISSPNAVVKFLNDKVRALGQAYAERVALSLAPDPDVRLESGFRLVPTPQPLIVEADPLQVGQLQPRTNSTMLVQIQMPALVVPGFRSLMRIEAAGDLMWDQRTDYRVIADTQIEVAATPQPEEPPLLILDALGKLTLYRMQQKAEEAASRGDFKEATRRLENLATRLLAAGHDDLAHAAIAEAQRVANTNLLSNEGQKRLKYGTRMLLTAGAKESSG